MIVFSGEGVRAADSSDEVENRNDARLIAPSENFEELADQFAATQFVDGKTRYRLVAVQFEFFNDGRGFSIAQVLRRAGYEGRLQARGRLIPDQWPLLRACGFNEVAIEEKTFQRQGAHNWHQANIDDIDDWQRDWETQRR